MELHPSIEILPSPCFWYKIGLASLSSRNANARNSLSCQEAHYEDEDANFATATVNVMIHAGLFVGTFTAWGPWSGDTDRTRSFLNNTWAGGSVEYAGSPEVSSATDGSCGGPVLRAGSRPPRGAALLLRICDRGGRVVIGTNGRPGFEVSEKGVTPALRAISCSPICQCMASAARHGIDISSAILDHMSALNLTRLSYQDPVGQISYHVAPHTFRTTSRAYSYDLRPIHSVFRDSSGSGADS